MKKIGKILNLHDMDVGLFVSYELTADALTTKLFRFITLNTVPVSNMKDIRKANEQDISRLNHLNWFDSAARHRSLCPIYTFKATEKTRRVFMRLNRGSHIDMKNTLSQWNDAA